MNPSSPDDERISAYLDGELSADELAAFESVLADRDDLQRAVDEMRSASRAVRELPRESLPPDFAKRVLRRAEQEMLVGDSSAEAGNSTAEPKETSWVRRLFWPIAALAASLLLLLAGPQLQQAEVETAESPAAVDNRPVANSELAEPQDLTTPANEAVALAESPQKDVSAFRTYGSDSPATSETVNLLEVPMEVSESDVESGNTRLSYAEKNMADHFVADTDGMPQPTAALLKSLPATLPTYEDYDAITNVQLVETNTIKSFYSTLVRNNIQVEQQVAINEKQANLEVQPTADSQDSQQIEMVLVNARPEKLQNVINELASKNCTLQIVGNPNSPASESIQSVFAGVVEATPDFAKQQSDVVLKQWNRWYESGPAAESLPTRRFVRTVAESDKGASLSNLTCQAFPLGQVAADAAPKRTFDQLQSQRQDQLQLGVATPKKQLVPGDELLRRRESKLTQLAKENQPLQQKQDQIDRMRMLFYVRKSDGLPNIVTPKK